MNASLVFEHIVKEMISYIKLYDLKSMVLGISGGIDSTVVAAICNEVSKRIGVTFIGRSLTIKNKKEEFTTAKIVGNAFCNNFNEIDLNSAYEEIMDIVTRRDTQCLNHQTLIANGNIQARLRMIMLYNLAGINKGFVIDTDNLTEHYLGFFTIHGDQGDYNPIGHLWKTEVYELAKWLYTKYKNEGEYEKSNAIQQSINLVPTDGLGISNSDLDQIGAKTYDDVDEILQYVIYNKDKDITVLYNKFGKEVVDKVINRYKSSEFKRKQLPIVIELNDIDFNIKHTIYGKR